MKYLIAFYLCLMLLLSVSCSGEKTQSWDINNFNEKKTFSLESPKNKSINNVNVFVEGNFSGNIKLQRSKGYPVIEFSKDSIPERLFYDFYGGKFKINLLPSNAQGEIKLTIKIPYN